MDSRVPPALFDILSFIQPLSRSTGKMFIGPGLLSATGDMHRKQRKMLAPVFSAKHLKDMTKTFYGVTKNVRSAFPRC